MAGVFDPQLNAQAINPIIDKPVDNSQLAGQVAGIVTKGITGLARQSAINDLTGNARVAAEVEADPSLLPEAGGNAAEQESAMNSINTLQRLAAARKAGLPIGQARTRATAILKRAVNENPVFADDVRKAYNNFFGGTGAGSIFELTAEEKALEKYKGDVMTRSLELGIDTTAAAGSIRKEQQNKLFMAELETQAKEMSLNADGYLNYANINAQDAVGNVMRNVIAVVRSRGALSPEDLISAKGQLRLLGSQLKQQQAALLRDENGQPILNMVDRQGVDAANDLIDDQIKNAILLLDDQAALKLSADNYNMLNNNFNTAVIKNFGAFKAIKEALGEQGATLYFQKMLGNKAFNTVAMQDPFVKSVIRAGDNFANDFSNAVGTAFSAASGSADPKTPEAKVGFLSMMQGEESKPVLGKLKDMPDNQVDDLAMQAVSESPDSIAVFNQRGWKARIANDPRYLEIAQSGMKGAAKAAKRFIVNDLDSFDLSGVELTTGGSPETMPRYMQEQGVVGEDVLVINGDLSSSTKDKIKQMYKVARQNPTLWQGQYETSLDYIQALVGVPAKVVQGDMTNE